MFDRILVVCAGNICRSPIGEELLKLALPNKHISSAGLVAKNGMLADANSISVCQQRGVNIEHHEATKLSGTLCSQSDLILVMEPQHRQDIAAKYPQASGKTMLLGKWTGVDVIPDPHQQQIEAFEHAYVLIEQACEAWAKRLK